MSALAKTDRVFKLTPRPGATVASNGLVDNRLFKGDNKLHAIMDEQLCSWSMKYERGGIPEPLKGNFTSFSKLKETAERYFNSREVDIVEVDNA
jgi:hypothetical protein